jgi:8-oxo-dGTP pyrophosphatase MutT (NUDIX family)
MMQSNVMSANVGVASALKRNGIRSSVGRANLTSSVVRLSQLRKLRDCEQVAAVCYRLHDDAIEFLLVRTRGSGRWTFPKGSAEPGLTHAQAAAVEAFEEAGVHGRIEEAPFTSYVCRKRDARKSSGSSGRRELAVNAHLCEVMRLTKPKEMNRGRTWFCVKEATRRLREGRPNDEGAEFARVLEKALARIQQAHRADDIVAGQAARAQVNDPLRRIQFEAAAEPRGMAWTPGYNSHRGQRLIKKFVPPGFSPTSRKVLPCEVLEFSLAGQKKPPALGSGAKLR